MAISITWGTKVIYVPRTDLTLIQASPEVRELDLNWFRLQLKNLEDDEEGMPFPTTHNHSTEVSLAGLTYARIIEIINGYTVEFESGQYTVNCVGANHNLSDVKVANSVSLIVNNAAGLITNAAIEYSSYNGGVTIDVGNISGKAKSGTLFPTGTPQAPVDNIDDAFIIAEYRGFPTFFILGNLDITSSTPDLSDYRFIGGGMDRTLISIDSNAVVDDCEYRDATITGTLDGNNRLVDCMIDDLLYVKGIIERCVLTTAVITLGGGEEAHFLDCWSGVPGLTTPVIDMGGSGQALALRNYNGGITLRNKTGAEAVSIDLNSGQIILEDTVTNGEIVCRGIGKLTDNSNGAVVSADDLLRSDVISRAVWDESIADHKVAGSFGDELATKADVKGAVSSVYHSSSAGVIVYGSNVSGSYSDAATRNNVYWQIQENAATGLTVEFIFNITGENKPGEFSIFGRYEGVPSTTHFMNLQAYNYEAAEWETLASGFMPGGNTSDLEFKHEYYERNIDRDNNNEVKVRLVHNVTTYSASHNLYIDSAILSCLEVVSAEEIASAVWNDSNALAVLSDLAFIKSIEGGRWVISGGQMIFYQDDNTTEIARFDLTYDANQNPVERARI